MKKIFGLIVFVLLIAGWALSAASLYVVRGQDRIVIIPKKQVNWRDTYVDTRKWTLDDIPAHPAVVSRLIENQKASVLQHILPEATGDALPIALHAAIERGPKTKAIPATRADEQSTVLRGM